jgi:hypothetical protein
MNKLTLALGLLLMASGPEAQALNQEIRALFQPDSSKPTKNAFVNQTPNSGYCATHPTECANFRMFSIRVPARFTSSRYVGIFDSVGVKAPAAWRNLTVTNTQTQATEMLAVRIIGLGSNYVLSHPAMRLAGGSTPLEAHGRLWMTNSWVNGVPGPCTYSGVAEHGPETFRFFWKTPFQAMCAKVPAYHIPGMSFDTLDFAYEMMTPNPLSMASGRYVGSLTYTLGPGGDFDMGPLMQADDPALTLDFVLDVQHTLKVDVPSGGNHIVLEPQGGWRSWLENGRKPVRLYRDQIFHISASSKFTMKLECEHSMGVGSGCAIIDRETRYGGGVDVSVSLPNGLTDGAGQPVKRFLLRPQNSPVFQPSFYVDRRPGTLHFEVDKNYTDLLIDNAQGRPYQGNITVVWDSEVG